MSEKASDVLLQRLLALHPRLIDLSLDRMWRLLAALDHPQDKCPPIIHIAGTNGKGSTAAMLRAILEADGKRVHAYHSPHLVRFHERIILAGEEIAEPLLEEALARVETANGNRPITFFEVTTAAAFLAFAEHPADYLILEVGLGGRLDATNVVTPKCAAITAISMDHQDFLGDTILSIAEEKAGILKVGVPAIMAKQDTTVAAFLKDYAAKRGVPLHPSGTLMPAGTQMVFTGQDGPIKLPQPALTGAHQLDNAATALTLAERCGVGETAMAIGLATVQWPARLQNLTQGALVEKVKAALPEAELRLDGGHNPAAANALADWLATHKASRDLHIILGMLNSKAHDDYLRALADCGGHIHAVPITDNDNALTPDALKQAAEEAGLSAMAHKNWRAAVAHICEHAENNDALLVFAGSLYLAGDILAANMNESELPL